MATPVTLQMEASGTTAARYEILGPIGKGATGSLSQAYDHALFRMIALKVLDVSAGDAAQLSFKRERKALSRMQHDNVVTLFDCRPRAEKPFMALSYHRGPSLKSVLASGALSEPDAAAVAHEISRALEHVHGHGFVYRDVKPENVLIDDERVILIDFGTAAELGVDETAGEVVGTLGFMAPEQYDGQQVGPHSDVFGLGALLYEAVVGTTPYGVFAKRRRCIRPHRYVHPSEARPDLSDAFAAIVHRALALDPSQRFSTVGEFRQALSECFAGHGTVDPRARVRTLVDARP